MCICAHVRVYTRYVWPCFAILVRTILIIIIRAYTFAMKIYQREYVFLCVCVYVFVPVFVCVCRLRACVCMHVCELVHACVCVCFAYDNWRKSNENKESTKYYKCFVCTESQTL